MSSSSSTSRPSMNNWPRYCDCGHRLYVKTSWTSTNPARRFISCPDFDKRSKCKVYRFLDEELPSDYYKEMMYGLRLETMKLKSDAEHYVDIEGVKGLKMEKQKVIDELTFTKSKLKLIEKALPVVVLLCLGVCILAMKL